MPWLRFAIFLVVSSLAVASPARAQEAITDDSVNSAVVGSSKGEPKTPGVEVSFRANSPRFSYELRVGDGQCTTPCSLRIARGPHRVTILNLYKEGRAYGDLGTPNEMVTIGEHSVTLQVDHSRLGQHVWGGVLLTAGVGHLINGLLNLGISIKYGEDGGTLFSIPFLVVGSALTPIGIWMLATHWGGVKEVPAQRQRTASRTHGKFRFTGAGFAPAPGGGGMLGCSGVFE